MNENQIDIHPEDQELIKDYQNGMNYKQILEKHELAHLEELYLILNEYNIPLRRKHNSSIARYEKIYNLYKQGYSTREIISLAGVTKNQVYNALHRFGVGVINSSEKEMQKKRHEKFYNLYKQGYSVKEICSSENVHPTTVYRALNKFGVDIREKSK